MDYTDYKGYSHQITSLINNMTLIFILSLLSNQDDQTITISFDLTQVWIELSS